MSDEVLPESCVALFMEFISHTGDHVINIDSNTVTAIKEKVHKKEYSRDMFDDAQREVIKLMAENSWLEFKASKYYRSPRDSISGTFSHSNSRPFSFTPLK